MENIIDGKYEILEKIGSGGTSNVYRAKRISDGTIVAVKVIRDDVEDIDEQEKAFRHEAEALSKLSHRNVRRILAVGQWNDLLYMVTEYVDGRTLKDIISEKGPLPQKTALDYALQIVAGVEHAHLKNIIHRDIKPQNVLVSNDGTAKLVDFGIARVISQKTKTMGGRNIVGSVHYFSPEQARGTVVDSRTDIYSLGVVLYEMFTGHLPFEGDEAVSIAMKHINAVPPEPKDLNPAVSDGMNDIILKCMEKNPANRYQTASELREDLLLYVANPDSFSVYRASARMKEEYEKDFDYSDEAQEDVSRLRTRAKSEKNRELLVIIAAIAASIAVIAIVISVIWTNVLSGEDYEEKAVPVILNQTKDAAVEILKNESFLKYEFIDVTSSTVPEGYVVETDPEAGETVKVNTEIKVYISKGANQVIPENTVGKDYNEATSILKAQGFNVEYLYVAQSGTEGEVIAQSVVNKQVSEGSTITLTVIQRSPMKTLKAPDLEGCTEAEAKEKLASAGFELGAVREQKTGDKNKTGVIWQSVEAGKECSSPSSGGKATIDIAIAVYSIDYICVYEYSVPDEYRGKSFDLIVFDSDSKQTEYVYNDVSGDKITCTFTSNKSKSETVRFELYYNNKLIDKQTMDTYAAE